jgi:mRNA interferase RelE/StbE
MFNIVLHPRADKFLLKISKNDQKQIILKIQKLKSNPFNAELDIKKLATTQRSYRLRIRRFRIIYELDSDKKTIYINDIDFRGNIY